MSGPGQGTAERLKLLQHREERLQAKPEQFAIWQAVHALLPVGHPHVGSDYGLENFLIERIWEGATVDWCQRHIPKIARRERFDRKAAASGEKLELGVT